MISLWRNAEGRTRRERPLTALVLLPVVLSVLGACSSRVDAQVVSQDFQVSPDAGRQYEPQIAASGQNVLAVWGGESGSVRVGSAYSTDGGLSWILAPDLAPISPPAGRIVRAPSLTVDADGHFTLAVIFSQLAPSLEYGVAIYRGVIGGAGLAWSGPFVAVGPIPSVSSSCGGSPLGIQRVACNGGLGLLFMTYVRQGPSCEREVYLVRSSDGGESWSLPLLLSSTTSATGSDLTVGPDGEVLVVWRDFASDQIVGRRSTDFGVNFGPQFVVANAPSNPGMLPPDWQAPEARFAARTGAALGSEFPSVAVDQSQGPRRGRTYVAWAERVAADVPPAAGTTGNAEPNDFPSEAILVPLGNDIVGAVSDVHFEFDDDWYAVDVLEGTTIHLSGQVTDVVPYDPNLEPYGHFVLVYCQDELGNYRLIESLNIKTTYTSSQPPPVVYTFPRTGRYYLRTYSGVPAKAYRLRLRSLAAGPGAGARDHRDVMLAWSDDGGQTWSPKVRVNDDAAVAEQTFPRVVVDNAGQLHVAWYDRRGETECEQRVHTYWARSVDGGLTFEPNRQMSTASGSWLTSNAADSNIGDRLGMTAEGGTVFVAWTDLRHATAYDTHGNIFAATISDVATSIAVPRFVAGLKDGVVELGWTVRDATGIDGFRVHRAEGNRTPIALNQEPLEAIGVGDYSYRDTSVEPGQTYRYRLEILRAGGSSSEGPLTVSIPRAIIALTFGPTAPNPFAGGTTLTLMSPEGGNAIVRVFDVTGHEVAEVHRGFVPPGVSPLSWAGRDRRGRQVPAGVYLVRAELNGESATARVIRIP